jgi:hypothetical protein
MRNQDILLSLLASLAATGCKQIECGEGTIDRNGICAPGDGVIDPAKCGEGTMLVGDRCEPVYPPTECDPATTTMETDETTGVTMCVGIGGVGIACPNPSGATKETICGQLYDFETNEKLEAANATGAECDPDAPAADGPCAVTIVVYDASAFAQNPSGATPVSVGSLTINDHGEFALADVETSQINPFVGLGVDDAGAQMGPGGYAVTSAIAFNKEPNTKKRGVELWVVRPATTTAWAADGPDVLNTGIYAAVFRAHKEGIGDQYTNQAGVTITGPGTPNDFYFMAADTDRANIDTSATSTGANGTVLVTNTGVLTSPWSGTGGITDTANCKWDQHIAATLQGIVFIQPFRKVDQFGKTCAE